MAAASRGDLARLSFNVQKRRGSSEPGSTPQLDPRQRQPDTEVPP